MRGIEKIRQTKLGRAAQAKAPEPEPIPSSPMLGDYVITFETEHRIETWWRVGRQRVEAGARVIDAALTKGFAIRSFDLASLRYMKRTAKGNVACWELK